MADEGECIQVAVRVRCYSQREINANATLVVRMEQHDKGSSTYIKDENGNERKFNYDYSFQSFSQTEPGIGTWADQNVVFETVGRPVMESALEGKNVCLFAYGQTGSGKSYSMLGKQDDPGIIPRTCDAIFNLIDNNTDPHLTYKVDIQVVEIYCEIINDLLSDRKQWPQHGHKPRFTGTEGYVVDTVRKPCFKYADIQSAFRFADQNRSVGSHALNPESSRAHTIYTINYQRQKRNDDGKVIETITARLNLVDLAGSEKCEVAGTSGDMLKEGNAINLALGALGSCIKSLSEHTKPNFRDSKLTLLLQASMTNGRVVMIAALSPANICHAESVSTLMFADRIKQVKIKASKNVTSDPVAEIKKIMEEERQRLQIEIDTLRKKVVGEAGTSGDAMDELQQALQAQKEATDSMKEEYARKLRELEESEGERAKRLAEINGMQKIALGGASSEEVKGPHLRNLHEDPRLAETLLYPFKEGTTVIGKADKERPPDLEFNGMGMIRNHATVTYEGGKVTMTAGPLSLTFINGKPLAGTVELRDNMRVWLGNNYAFRFAFPGKEAEGEQFETPPDYAFAEQEISDNASDGVDLGASQSLTAQIGQKLSDALKKVEQANLVALDLGQQMNFEAKIFKNRVSGENDIVIRVNSKVGTLFWPWDKFNERLVRMSNEWEAWQRCEESGTRYVLPEGALNPFIDRDYQLIGECDVWLRSLANMIEHHADPSILSVAGRVEGRARISIMPCDSNGKEGPWDDTEELDPFVDDPSELLDEEVRFRVKIHNAVFDAGDRAYCRYQNTFVRYNINPSDPASEWVETEKNAECTFNPKYNFKKLHTLTVTPDVLKLLLRGRIIFQVWGKIATEPTDDGVPRTGKRGELAKLDADIAEKRRVIADLDAKIQECKERLTPSA
eukprot:TRINITY_DN2068_c0_g1_i2.p1 TRINITY_DN2068_c0_g1~~TRINITY_DN2068_c0_g1_i2.p1  ORF type:complete len:916 (-),score=316.03 TRINITY_DN2068_c0_g1_i2:289-3003(-)